MSIILEELTRIKKKVASITHSLRLSSICVLCNQYHNESTAVCFNCQACLIKLTNKCQYCAVSLGGEYIVCGHCVTKKPYFDKVYCQYHFCELLRSLLHEFKYKQGLYLTSFFASLIIENLPSSALETECLIPVPLYRKKLNERGFNQVYELTKYLSKKLGVKYDVNICKKLKHTSPQANLNRQQRQKNLRGAFSIENTQYRHITLVDDLLTTGSTVNEIALELKQRGVLQVDVWTCVRASL